MSEKTHNYQQNNDKLHKKVQVTTTGYQGIKDPPQSPASNGAIDFNAFGALSRKLRIVKIGYGSKDRGKCRSGIGGANP